MVESLLIFNWIKSEISSCQNIQNLGDLQLISAITQCEFNWVCHVINVNWLT